MPNNDPQHPDNTPVEPEQSDSGCDRQLNSPPPRRVALRAEYYGWWSTTFCFLLAVVLVAYWSPKVTGFLFCIFILWLLLSSLQVSRQKSKLFVARGVATRGVVVNKTEIGPDESLYSYDYSVAYDSPMGSHKLYFSGYDEYSVGDTLTVLYLPDNPDNAVLYSNCWHVGVENAEVSRDAGGKPAEPTSTVSS